MINILIDTLIDSLKLLPFLLVTYLLMEYIEHKTNEKTKNMIQKSGKFGPVFGSLLGVVPQCGFSVVATNFYAARIITLGTLISIYLSTSDEMLPILISEGTSIPIILKIVFIKIVIALSAGFIIDFILRKTKTKPAENEKIGDMCEHEHCHCEEGITKSAVKHTIHIFLFIIAITLLLNVLMDWVGEDTLANFIQNQTILGPVIAGIIGLIPNCVSSVLLTKLYLSEVIPMATMLSGLLVNAGVGLLVLFRVNHNVKENIKITVLLYTIGVLSGILLQFLQI